MTADEFDGDGEFDDLLGLVGVLVDDIRFGGIRLGLLFGLLKELGLLVVGRPCFLVSWCGVSRFVVSLG